MAGGMTPALDERLMQIWRTAAEQRMPLPTEVELAATLGVSRPTVREALVRLEADGLVARRAHQGTFPNVAALDVPFRIDQSYELTGRLEAAGYEVEVDVLSAGWSTLRREEANDLETFEGSPCFRVVKRWIADGRPLIVADDAIPARERDDVVFDADYSVFSVVNGLRGASVEWESARIGAQLPTEAEAEWLAIETATPLLEISTVGVSLHGDRLFRARELHVNGGLAYGMLRGASWRSSHAG